LTKCLRPILCQKKNRLLLHQQKDDWAEKPLDPCQHRMFSRCAAPASTFNLNSKDKKNKLTRFDDEDDSEIDSAPFTFRGSGADQYRSHESFIFRKTTVPVTQPWIVVISVAAFLLWFFIFRDENDMDDILRRDTLEAVPTQFEEDVILVAIDLVKDEGGDTKELELMLKKAREKKG